MARKEVTVTITAEGRDQGKVFRLREMPASRAEAWAARLLICLAKSGIEVPDNIADMGMAGVAAIAIRGIGGIPWHDAKPLMDEMFQCVQYQPNPAQPGVVRPLMESTALGADGNEDIEEVATRIQLREELITLHTGFSIAAKISNSQTEAA